MTTFLTRWLACCRWLLLIPLLATGAASAAVTAAPGNEPIVIVMSWDGVRHDYPDLTELPGLARVAGEGVRAGRLTPVFPSNTFPGHVSLATGTHPDRHGIIDNHFYDRDGRQYRYSADADWIEAEPLWIAAERQGVPAATYFWVGSETDWQGQGTRYRIAPFDSDRPESAKVDQMLEWLAMPEDRRPRLIMSYWAGADHEGHDHGPDADVVVEQMQAQDRQLQRLLAGIDDLGLWPRTTLIIVSDHGMTDMARFLDLPGALEDAGIGARTVGSAVANVYLDDPGQLDAALAAVSELSPARVYRRAEVPAELRMAHPTRTGDLVLITDPPFTFSRPRGAAGFLQSVLYTLGWGFGGHGYDPRLPDMGGIFLAMGRGVPPRLVLPEVQQIDVAATVARLLNIEPPRDSEGHAVRGIGEHLVGAGR